MHPAEPEHLSSHHTRQAPRIGRWRWGLATLMVVCFGLYLPLRLRPIEVSAQEKTGNAAGASDPAAIYEEIHKKSHEAVELIEQSIKAGAPITGCATVVAAWSHRLLSSDMYRCMSKEGGARTADPEVYLSTATGPPDPERLKAFREHVSRMKRWETRLRPLDAKQYLSRLEFYELQARRLQAEAWEAMELNKPAR